MPTRPSNRRAALALAFALVAGACSGSGRENGDMPPESRPFADATTTTASTVVEEGAVRVVAAGDIACKPGQETSASQCRHGETAELAASLDPDVVLVLGDLQYERGEAEGFAASYDPTWGRLRDRTRPAPGNHEYAGGRARGYFGYWGEAAHPPNGWYSFDAGRWHVVVLNSVCSVVGCGAGSEQARWLAQDLAAASAAGARCTLAAFHHPRWSSGLHGSEDAMAELWRVFVAGGGDVALAGHDHHYERLAAPGGGTQFVVGTGGRNLYPVVRRIDGSEFVDTRHFGVLELELLDGKYRYRFHAVGAGVLDGGEADCT
ncbi:MAG TPA: metallophosphoesterase [Acidimicrobiales bacterium]